MGSHLSTFSDYIHILRGQIGKVDFHRMGLNFNRGNLMYDEYPWESEEYSWDKTWDYQWRIDNNI